VPSASIEQYLSQSGEPEYDYVDGVLEERSIGERTHSRTQAKVGSFLLTQGERLGLDVFTSLHVRVHATRCRIVDICATIGDPEKECSPSRRTESPSLEMPLAGLWG
jgi:hypothetical protein